MDFSNASITASKPRDDYLMRASNSIDAALNYDSKYPELGDIFGHGQSENYEKCPSPLWEPFEWQRLITIPDEIFEQYNQTQCITQMGLFTEIERAWISVDNKLFLWNFMNQQDFEAFEELKQTITSVALVTPRHGVFITSIKYLLIIATTTQIIILGVQISEKGSLALYRTDLTVPLSGIMVKLITGTDDGRIFFCTNSDQHIFEIEYQSENTFRFSKCRKVLRTGSYWDFLVPSFLSAQNFDERIAQFAVDNSRKLLYTLSTKSTIRCYYLQNYSSFQNCLVYTYSSLISHAHMFNATSTLLDIKSSKIASIAIVEKCISSQIYLIAMTTSGCRLYLRAARSGFQFAGTASQNFPNTMQVTHVRFPKPSENVVVQSGFLAEDGIKKESTQEMKSSIKLNNLSTHFGPGFFFGVCESPEVSLGNTLFLAAPNAGKISLAYHAKIQPYLHESAQIIPLQGFVQAISPIPDSCLRDFNELASQYISKPLKFAVLTNSGVHIVSRRRPLNVLLSVIQNLASVSNFQDTELRHFLESFGRAEACATSLGLIVGQYELQVEENAVSRIITSEKFVSDNARRCFLDFGGRPHFDEAMLSIQTGDIPTIDLVRLSGRHDGLALFLCRSFRKIWHKFIVRATNKQGRPLSVLPNIEQTELFYTQSRLLNLLRFLEDNKKFIDGLTGPERSSYGNEALELASQAEHRGMYSLLTFLQRTIEAISFLQLLFERDGNYLTNILTSLSEESQSQILQMSIKDFVSKPLGAERAKEIVNAIINYQISGQSGIDTITDTLRRRCGAFCSADDIVFFKALELIRKAHTVIEDTKERAALLHESLRLLQNIPASLSMEKLRVILDEYYELNFHPGAIQLLLIKAHISDPAQAGLKYYLEGQRQSDIRKSFFETRKQYYELAISTMEDVLKLRDNSVSEEHDKSASSLLDVTMKVVNNNNDELFHYHYFDWLISKGQYEQLSSSDSPFILKYLERQSNNNANLSDLFYQVLAKDGRFLEAATVLYELAWTNNDLKLQDRITYLSIARGYCNCNVPESMRSTLEQRSSNIQELLDVAGVQDLILKESTDDTHLSLDEKQKALSVLDGRILPLNELFNDYADPLHYYDLCILIFSMSDSRDRQMIYSYWTKLFNEIRERNDESTLNIFKELSNVIQRSGAQFMESEIIFPFRKLISLASQYNLELGNGDAGYFTHWVPESFILAGLQPMVVLTVLNDLFELKQYPFNSKLAMWILVNDILFTVKYWISMNEQRLSKKSIDFSQKDTIERLLKSYLESNVLNVDQQRKIREQILVLLDKIS